MPIHTDELSPYKKEILENLDYLESGAPQYDSYGMDDDIADSVEVLHMKGWSTCRCCGKMNGSREFSYKGWNWPEGFRHYIEIHNVVPSAEFLKEVLGIEL